MRNLLRYLFIFCLALVLSACASSPYRQVKSNEIIEDKYLLFKALFNSKIWNVSSKYNRVQWSLEKGTPSIYAANGDMQFSIYTEPYHYRKMKKHFIKNSFFTQMFLVVYHY